MIFQQHQNCFDPLNEILHEWITYHVHHVHEWIKYLLVLLPVHTCPGKLFVLDSCVEVTVAF